MLQNFVNLCNQRPPEGFRMHQIRFAPGSAADPAGGAHDARPDPLVRWEGKPPPHTPPHSTPWASRSWHLLVCYPNLLIFVPACLGRETEWKHNYCQPWQR